MDETRARRLTVSTLLSSLLFACGCQQSPTGVVERLPPPVYSPMAQHVVGPRAPVRTPEPEPPVKKPSEWEPAGGVSQRWNSIVIHHSDSHNGSLGEIDQWHRHNGWDGCGYHFVIGNGTDSPDGHVEMSYRWRMQLTGAHCRLPQEEEIRRRLSKNYYNEHGIGICLVGRFDHEAPTRRQLDAASRLLHFLMEECQIPESRIYGHGDLKSTSCPGRHLSVADLVRRARTLSASAKR